VNVIVAQTAKEKEDAYSIRRIVFVQEQNVPLEEEIDQFDKDSVHFVLYDQNKAIGAGRYRLVDSYGKVERICILKNSRKGGAGKKLMNAIEVYALSHQASSLKLNAQTHAIPFYEKLGYKAVSEEFLDAGIPHKTMIKILQHKAKLQ